ncbi:RhoGAP-domain-containing protein [Gymnopus androsaceus JB14]|uniref:RhoGAP-domain-containing protein n=1 Tax=Gymnopus androsaceus JB14 TaxID=1447944 RepID=A0A6A4IW76_9AGAR|nr:RhoGAP-domain-containing protein [Gymnopus androsaceus JB14]
MLPIPKKSRPSPSGWPDNSSSTSSSSYSSYSAASDMLPQDSSQSDIVSSDHTTPLPAPIPRHATAHDLAVAASRPRTSSLAVVMGQNYSKPKGLSISTAAASTGTKLKRAFVGRRKKSEDATKLFAVNDKGKEKEWDSPISSTSPSSQAFSGGRKASAKAPPQLSPTPPTPPPKPWAMQPGKLTPASASPSLPPKVQTTLKPDNRGSIIPISPGISSAVNFMRLGEQEREAEQAREREAAAKEAAAKEVEQDDQKDVWRKSDSAMSHHTVRPGAGAGPRSSRPVSMAESLQSNHTVVPVNKRLSALITDAEFETPEEEDDSSFKSALEEVPLATQSPSSSSTSSLSVKNRRSMSLNLGSKSNKAAIPTPPSTIAGTLNESKTSFKSINEPHPRMSPPSASETPTLTRAAANGFIAPSSSGVQSTGNNLRGRLAAWTATNNQNPASRPGPPSAFHRTPSPQPPHQRAAAISITGSLAPAANLARRAAEKFGRWGGFSSSSSGSGYSSSSSSTSDHGLGRTISKDSSGQLSSGKGKQRRTPEAPSGAWSVNSSAGGSLSDSDALLIPSGPSLGTQIRGSLRMNATGAPVAGGIVFGRKLVTVVNDTAVGVGIPNYFSRPDHGELRALETRRLPALVVRCAQHLLLWGVGEEGLFRVSGRPSHVSKLRHEFDTGADYNMQECSPGELDPHAVASVFKAFLRELPEPLLTHSLSPYFEAALAHENATNEQLQQDQPHSQYVMGGRGPSLPSAMPNFSGMRPPSRGLLNAFKSLVGQLPAENRDLIRTVAELIRATAKESRQTKMPLSNLLLVFCPSLNMNPPLLRVLCEAEDIWEVDDTASVLTSCTRGEEEDEEEMEPSAPEVVDEVDETPVASASIVVSTPPTSPQSLIHGEEPLSVEPRPTSEDRKNQNRAKKPLGPRRAAHSPSPAVVHTDNHNALSAVGNDAQPSVSPDVSSESISLHDDGASSISTSDSRSESVVSPFERGVSSPPPLTSSSAESLTSPSTSSAEPSLAHLPLEKTSLDKEDPTEVVRIAEEDVLTPRRFLGSQIAGGPVQFPTTSDSPTTAVSLRMSLSGLSLPDSPVSTNSAPSSPRAHRSSLPLCHHPTCTHRIHPRIPPFQRLHPRLLLPKSSTFTLPPLLDTTIQSSPLRFGLGFDPQPSPEVDAHTSAEQSEEQYVEEPVSIVIGETPIANRYCTPSSSTLSLSLSNYTAPAASHLRSRPARTKQASSNHLGVPLGDQEGQEDWTQSVLLAADSEGNWSLS